jgi:hypothetical protein
LSGYFQHTFRLSNNKDEYKEYGNAKINYSPELVSTHELWIQPDGLLFEVGIKKLNPQTFQHKNGYIVISLVKENKGFDLLSSIFYLLSRYEEYLPHEKDLYGRYAHENSLAYKYGFLQLPLINLWLEDFRKSLCLQNSQLQLEKIPFTFIPTYDIDIAWSFKNKGVFRNIGGIAKSIVKREFASVQERLKVLAGKRDDPFDVYDWLNDLHKKHRLSPLYFFHVGRKHNKYDKNISINNFHFKQLIKKTSSHNKTGLHPSWKSSDDPYLLDLEKSTLEDITGKEISASRQHYIKLELPKTYRALIHAGISEDYTMGYGSINGFRASVAAPFFWYDLRAEETTGLKIYPFCFMDANSFFEQKNTPAEGLEEIVELHNLVKSTGGTFISIWHNNFLGSHKLYKGWKEVYLQFIEQPSKNVL